MSAVPGAGVEPHTHDPQPNSVHVPQMRPGVSRGTFLIPAEFPDAVIPGFQLQRDMPDPHVIQVVPQPVQMAGWVSSSGATT